VNTPFFANAFLLRAQVPHRLAPSSAVFVLAKAAHIPLRAYVRILDAKLPSILDVIRTRRAFALSVLMDVACFATLDTAPLFRATAHRHRRKTNQTAHQRR
jgi:hypothetical protein